MKGLISWQEGVRGWGNVLWLRRRRNRLRSLPLVRDACLYGSRWLPHLLHTLLRISYICDKHDCKYVVASSKCMQSGLDHETH